MSQTDIIALVVEDDELVRIFVTAALEEAGFTVVEAGTADEAIAILQQRTDIAVLITDISMPGSFNGAELVWRVCERWPHIPSIVISARPREDDLPPRTLFFAKPFPAERLVAAVRNLTE